jgi:hypothetical protein
MGLLPYYGESVEGDYKLELAVRREFPGIPIYFTKPANLSFRGFPAKLKKWAEYSRRRA